MSNTFEGLLDENAILARGLAAAQRRSTRQFNELARRIESQESLILRLRGQLIARDTAIAALSDDLSCQATRSRGARSRVELAPERERILDRERPG